jgi:hypothetical protein
MDFRDKIAGGVRVDLGHGKTIPSRAVADYCNGPDEVESPPCDRHAAELTLLSVVDAKAATLCCSLHDSCPGFATLATLACMATAPMTTKFVLLGYALVRFVDVLDAILKRFAFWWQ